MRPAWERGQNRASEPDRGLDRPLLQASPEARNLRPPQSPGDSNLVQGQHLGYSVQGQELGGRKHQRGLKGLKGGHLILSGCEKPPIVSSSSRCYVVVNIRVSPISNTYHWWSNMCTLKEDTYVTSVGVCHLSYTIVNGMLSWWHNNNILGSNHIVTTHKNIETSKTIETKYQICPGEVNRKNHPEKITWKIVPPWWCFLYAAALLAVPPQWQRHAPWLQRFLSGCRWYF